MVTEPEIIPVDSIPDRATSWSLWTRQTIAIMGLEIKKNFLSRRALLLYLIAVLPLALLSALTLFPPDTDEMHPTRESFPASARYSITPRPNSEARCPPPDKATPNLLMRILSAEGPPCGLRLVDPDAAGEVCPETPCR